MSKASARSESHVQPQHTDTLQPQPFLHGYSSGIGRADSAVLLTPLAPFILFAVVALLWSGKRNRSQRFWKQASLQRSATEETLSHGDPEQPWLFGTSRYCPVCTGEYIAGTDECEDCGVELVDEEDLPEQLAVSLSRESIVRVGRIRTMSQGHLIRSWFSTISIPCALQRCSPYDVFGTDIYVFESDALRAKRLLRHFLETDVVLS